MDELPDELLWLEPDDGLVGSAITLATVPTKSDKQGPSGRPVLITIGGARVEAALGASSFRRIQLGWLGWRPLREFYGLDQSLFPGQYLDYLGDLARLDPGTSQRTREPVTQMISGPSVGPCS